ncbi:MAG: hypothetical protein FJZ01_20195 [Candidatus Sericytochromatia bacterium]|nr:hypothetical protein [Candidatus Tanganyikabacteria bacterium]
MNIARLVAVGAAATLAGCANLGSLAGLLAAVGDDKGAPAGGPTATPAPVSTAPALRDIASPATSAPGVAIALSAKVDGASGEDIFQWSASGGTLSSATGTTVMWTPPTQAGPQVVTLIVTFRGGSRTTATLEFKVAGDGTVYREKLNLNAGAGAAAPTPLPTATPTPAPSPTPTLPSGKNALMLYSLSFESNVASRTVTVINTSTGSVNLDDYIISYEYEQSDYQLKMQHMRFGKGLTLQSLAMLTLSQNAGCTDGKCVAVDSSLGGTGATSLGIQVGKGSVVLYKGIVTNANAQDYLQYGAKPLYAWSHASLAASGSIWSGAETYAPAGAAGQSLRIKAIGSWGAANWQLL